jgi:hypothetical protein
MWAILGMPAPQVVPQSVVELTGPVGGWKRTLTHKAQTWTFQSLVKGVGAWYISPASCYLLVVETAEK